MPVTNERISSMEQSHVFLQQLSVYTGAYEGVVDFPAFLLVLIKLFR